VRRHWPELALGLPLIHAAMRLPRHRSSRSNILNPLHLSLPLQPLSVGNALRRLR
jgi:hypothetical protein